MVQSLAFGLSFLQRMDMKPVVVIGQSECEEMWPKEPVAGSPCTRGLVERCQQLTETLQQHSATVLPLFSAESFLLLHEAPHGSRWELRHTEAPGCLFLISPHATEIHLSKSTAQAHIKYITLKSAVTSSHHHPVQSNHQCLKPSSLLTNLYERLTISLIMSMGHGLPHTQFKINNGDMNTYFSFIIFIFSACSAPSSVTMDASLLQWSLNCGTIPLVCPVGRDGQGCSVLLDPTEVTAAISRTLQPHKVMFLNNSGGLRSQDRKARETG